MAEPKFKGETGAERAAKRLRWKLAMSGQPQPTKETRQNYRAMLRKANKMVAAQIRDAR